MSGSRFYGSPAGAFADAGFQRTSLLQASDTRRPALWQNSVEVAFRPRSARTADETQRKIHDIVPGASFRQWPAHSERSRIRQEATGFGLPSYAT